MHRTNFSQNVHLCGDCGGGGWRRRRRTAKRNQPCQHSLTGHHYCHHHLSLEHQTLGQCVLHPNDPASQRIHWRLSDLRIGTKMSHCTCAPDKFFSKRTFVWRLRRRRWRTAAAATATDSQAKSAVSAFADRAPLLLSSSQFHIKVCSICRMDNFHVPLGNRWRSLSVWYESYRQGLC